MNEDDSNEDDSIEDDLDEDDAEDRFDIVFLGWRRGFGLEVKVVPSSTTGLFIFSSFSFETNNEDVVSRVSPCPYSNSILVSKETRATRSRKPTTKASTAWGRREGGGSCAQSRLRLLVLS